MATEIRAARAAGWEPTHPGTLLREEVLPALRLSVAAAAEKLGVSRQALHNVLAGKAAVTPEMALRLGKLCGNGPDLWLRMQGARDLWLAEKAVAPVLEGIPTLGTMPPLAPIAAKAVARAKPGGGFVGFGTFSIKAGAKAAAAKKKKVGSMAGKKAGGRRQGAAKTAPTRRSARRAV
jgi:addiction module HigA family antidote